MLGLFSDNPFLGCVLINQKRNNTAIILSGGGTAGFNDIPFIGLLYIELFLCYWLALSQLQTDRKYQRGRKFMRKGTDGLGEEAAIFDQVPSNMAVIKYCGDDVCARFKRHSRTAVAVARKCC